MKTAGVWVLEFWLINFKTCNLFSESKQWNCVSDHKGHHRKPAPAFLCVSCSCSCSGHVVWLFFATGHCDSHEPSTYGLQLSELHLGGSLWQWWHCHLHVRRLDTINRHSNNKLCITKNCVKFWSYPSTMTVQPRSCPTCYTSSGNLTIVARLRHCREIVML